MKNFISWVLQVLITGALIFKLWEGKIEFAIMLGIWLYVINIENTLRNMTEVLRGDEE